MSRLREPLALALALWLAAGPACALETPHVRLTRGAAELMVHGKPFVMLGGELGNSSAGTAAEADSILPALERRHLNTVLVPVAWDQLEPQRGHFDFSVLDHWIAVARATRLHLVLLWFGSWKNAFSSYAPPWVLEHPSRFPRAVSASGTAMPMLSVFARASARADAEAFATLMRHLRSIDGRRQTVIMVQVENEVGYLGLGGRDRSRVANRLFDQPVPPALLRALERPRHRLPWPLASAFHPNGHDWHGTFGRLADEMFMAWYYGRYVQTVAAAGKRQYPLPMYMNAQLPAPHERAGEYPSGGPYPLCQPIYRAAAPAIDFYAPDIYWPDFERWIARYARQGNPAFVPESRLESAPYNALYVFGQARGFGFSAFGIDSAPAGAEGALAELYAALGALGDVLPEAQQQGATRALTLSLESPRPHRTVALGGYLFRATLLRSWHTGKPLATEGAMLIIEARPGVFDVLGSGLAVAFRRDPDVDGRIAGIASITQLARDHGRWIVRRPLNGDQSDQGRQLLMAPHTVRLYRVKLYAYARGITATGTADPPPRPSRPRAHHH